MKKCPRCKKCLSNSKYNWKINGKYLQSYCKLCSRKYIQEHYLKNRQYYINKAKRRNMKIQQICFSYIRRYLLAHPCVDCGEKDILVLEFDHIERSRKDKEISRIIRDNPTIDKLKYEMSKCKVRCANCHRRKTQKENKSWKMLIAPVA